MIHVKINWSWLVVVPGILVGWALERTWRFVTSPFEFKRG